MLIVKAAVCGFILDCFLGDPAWMPHPVVYMGKLITWAEKFLRARFPKTQKGEFRAGLCLAAGLPLITLLFTGTICLLAAWLRNVWKELQKEDLPAARKAVGRIVGRDTERLTAEGVIRAAVETVSENFSDGVAAPMLYMLLGGAPLALMYKSINTMDSMVGYKNEKYLWFGRAAAKLDDAANYIPARISALCWIASAALTGQDWKGAWRIWRRDRRCHASPNSAQTEAACAGSLGVQLAGPAWYFGELYDKPTIGDALRPVETDDILQAIRMMIAASTLLLAVCVAVRLGLCCI